MRTYMLHAVLAIAVVGIACEGPDDVTPPVTAWEAVLSGADVVPAVSTTAAGTAALAVTGATTVAYTVNISTLPGSAISSAAIHAAAPGANQANSTLNLCGTVAPAAAGPACPALGAPGVLVTGTWTGVTAAQLNTLRTFGYYLMVRTAANGTGEIRGQVRNVEP